MSHNLENNHNHTFDQAGRCVECGATFKGDHLVARSITVTPNADLQEAFEILNWLRSQRAAYFTAGELLWVAADDRRRQFVDDEQARAYVEEVRRLRERVEDRKLDWWQSRHE